jgi:SAM-dependent methyltransferase
MASSTIGQARRDPPMSAFVIERKHGAQGVREAPAPGRSACHDGAMPPVTGSSAGPAGPAAANDYDSFAEAYSAGNEVNLHNAYYERPATLALAEDVAGRRILDAGCGSGPLFAALRDRGAIMTGFDKSARMLELARRRLGDGADLRVADLGRPLPFPDGAFDDVIASLVLHYLEDWTAPLAELRRVLRPGGRLIASVDHPCRATRWSAPAPTTSRPTSTPSSPPPPAA